jgi:hypothetical protein
MVFKTCYKDAENTHTEKPENECFEEFRENMELIKRDLTQEIEEYVQ